MVHLKIFSLKNIKYIFKKLRNEFILLLHIIPTINHDATIILASTCLINI
jgi:hypothetical protein